MAGAEYESREELLGLFLMILISGFSDPCAPSLLS